MGLTPVSMAPLKRFIPRHVKSAIRNAYLQQRLDAAIGQVARLGAGECPSRSLLDDLQEGWDNEGMAARTDYLDEVCRRAARASGAILECGSGLTTLLLGLTAGRRGVHTWSLEHLPEWRDRVAAAVARHHVANVHLCLAPLTDHQDFAWYDVRPTTFPATFDLVVCDGPPSQTHGGRYGVLPLVGDHLVRDSVILLDDLDRPGEVEVLRRWSSERPMEVLTRGAGTGAFGILILS